MNFLCVDRMVLCPDCGGGYMDLYLSIHLTKKEMYHAINKKQNETSICKTVEI